MEKSRILLIDDDAAVASAIGRGLTLLAGYEVRTELDGRRAIEIAREFRPQLILLDVQAKGWTGPDVAAALGREPDLKTIPVAFLTAVIGQDESGGPGSDVAGRPIISKTSGLDGIAAAVRAALVRSLGDAERPAEELEEVSGASDLTRYRRLIISIPDLADARAACARLLELDEFDQPTGAMTLDFKANLTQLVVAYGRPFSRNHVAAYAARSLEGITDDLSPEELQLHKRLRDLWDQEFAHSDPRAAELHIYVRDGRVDVIGRVTRTPSLTRADVELAHRMIQKMEEAVWTARREIEPRLPPGAH